MRHVLMGLLAVASLAAHAEMNEIVVTASLREGSYNQMPAVTITKAADFLVQEIRLINDSRSPDLRKQEIIATIDGMLKRAAKDKTIALSYGEGFLQPVNLSDESLEIIEDKKRTDTSSVDIYVKVTLTAGDDTKLKIASLKSFIDKTQKAGRTEIEQLDDIGLSIVNPEKYRHEILTRIAEENGRLAKAMGQKCQVKTAGLEGRVQWDRTEVAELTLYIPYSVEIAQCSYESG